MGLKMNYGSLLILIIVGCLCESQGFKVTSPPSHDVRIEAKPTAIHDRYTKSLSVNCTFKHGPTSDFSTIMSLILSKSSSPTTDDYRELASMTAFNGDTVEQKDVMGAQVRGHFEARGQSFISFEWNYPKGEVEGRYKCEAFGMDKKGHPRNSIDITVIREKAVDLDLALSKLKDMDYELDDILQFQTNMMSRLQDSRDAMMESSIDYMGHKYYLSRPLLKNNAIFNMVCKSHGGYLLEINDVKEYVYMAQLVKDSGNLVAIGGKHSNNYNSIWTLDHTAGSVSYTDWLTGQPSTSREKACLYLSVHSPNAGMLNDVCVDNTHVRFICELE